MKTRTKDKGSRSGETRTRTTLRLSLRVVTGLVALLASVPLCHASASPGETNRNEEQPNRTPAEIPFRLYNDNLIVVKGSIGTIQEVNFIVDTGSNPTIITEKIAAQLDLRGKTGPLIMLNGTIQAESLIVPHLQIGPLRAESTKVLVQDLSSIERDLGITLGGIAGLDILSTANFSIDYQRKKIAFGSVAASQKAIPFEARSPSLLVKAEVNGQELRLVLDSGTPGLLIYRNRIDTTQEKLRFDPDRVILTAGKMSQVRWLRADLLLGKHHLGALDVAIADVDSNPENEFDGLLGFANMGFSKVTFDFQNGMFGWDQR